jgi:putative ABC transport system permease protein
VNDLRSVDTRIADALMGYRSPALVASIFSLIAILLIAVGTYGVLSYAVTQRRCEIGVRRALGARPGQIRSQFLALGLRLLAASVILGTIGPWLTGRAMQTILFQVRPFHVGTVAAAAVIIGVVSLIACLLPSRLAAQISPMEALADS